MTTEAVEEVDVVEEVLEMIDLATMVVDVTTIIMDEVEEEQVNLAKKVLTTIGNFSEMSEDDDVNQNIKALADIMLSVDDLKEYANEISDIFVKCFSTLSLQSPIIATILSLIHVKNQTFTTLVVNKLQTRLLSALSEDDVITSKNILKTIACMASSYAFMGGVQAVYHILPVENEGTPLLVGPGGVYDSLWEAMHIAREVIGQQSTAEGFVPPTSMITPWTNAAIALDLTRLKERVVPSLTFDETFNAQLQTLLKAHALGSRSRNCVAAGTNTGSVIGSAAATTWLKARIPIFDSETSPEAAQCTTRLSAVEKWTVVTAFQDIVYTFDPIICEDGTRVGSIDLMATHLLGVFKLYPQEAHVEYILLEVLFSNLLQQPVNHIQNASIYKLILTLCKRPNTSAPNVSFPPVVALIVNIVYQMIPDFDVSVVTEFANWFAFHLINTQLTWPYWEFWTDELVESLSFQDTSEFEDVDANGHDRNTTKGVSMLKLFASHFVSRLSTAVVFDKVKAILPPAFLSLLPAKVIAADGQVVVPTCSLFSLVPAAIEGDAMEEAALVETPLPAIFDGVVDARGLAENLKEQLESKTDPDEIVTWFEKVIDQNSTTSTAWCGVLLLEAIVSYGSTNNTLSGVTGLLDRYSEVIRTLAAVEEDQKVLIQSLISIYSLDSPMFAFLFDEMLRRGQISVTAAAEWVAAQIETGGLTQNTVVLGLGEVVVDRGIDFVKAAIAQRVTQHAGVAMAFDESLDLTPSEEPVKEVVEMSIETKSTLKKAAPLTTSSSNTTSADALENEEVDYGEDDDDEDTGRRQRSRRNEDDEEDNNADENNMATDENDEPAVDSLWFTTEAVKSSLLAARTVYRTLLTTLVNGIATARQVASPENDLFVVSAASLVREVLRAVHGAERALSHTYSQRVVLSENVNVSVEFQHVLKQIENGSV
eukprot:gene23991-30278_t